MPKIHPPNEFGGFLFGTTVRPEGERNSPIRVSETGYGWAVFLPTDADMCLTAKEKMLADGASKAMVALFVLVAKRGVSILNLDRDADEVEGLPTFSW